jgi:hypothetical protein
VKFLSSPPTVHCTVATSMCPYSYRFVAYFIDITTAHYTILQLLYLYKCKLHVYFAYNNKMLSAWVFKLMSFSNCKHLREALQRVGLSAPHVYAVGGGGYATLNHTINMFWSLWGMHIGMLTMQ